MLGLLSLVVSVVSAAAPAALGLSATDIVTAAAPTGTTAPDSFAFDKAYVLVFDGGTPTGTVQFYFCGPTASATSCAIANGNKDGGAVTVKGGGAEAPLVSPSTPGYYCWSAVYTSNSDAYSGSESTTTEDECFQVVAATATTTVTASAPTGTTAPDSFAIDTAMVIPFGGGTPTGTVQFYFCGPTASATSCAIATGNKDGGAVTVEGRSATSTGESPSTPGYYCWSAVYTSNSDAYSGSESTTTEDECFQVVAATTTTTVTTTVTSPITFTTTVPTTSTETSTTTTTVTTPSTTTTTATSTSTSTGTSTVLSGTCYDPEVTVTDTDTVSTTITTTSTRTFTTTLTGTVTSTVTSTTTVTVSTVVPVTTTTTSVSETTICSTTVTTTSPSVQGVPQFPGPSLSAVLVAVLLVPILALMARSRYRTTVSN